MKEQIEEMAKVLVDYTKKNHIMASHVILSDYAEQLHNAGYRKIIKCKDCEYFMEYSSEFARTTEGADGDCHIRLINSDNEQYRACQYDDFCSFAKIKGGAE
jgi:hypothetical protein